MFNLIKMNEDKEEYEEEVASLYHFLLPSPSLSLTHSPFAYFICAIAMLIIIIYLLWSHLTRVCADIISIFIVV